MLLDEPICGDCLGPISVGQDAEHRAELVVKWVKYLFLHNTWQLTGDGMTFLSRHYTRYPLEHRRNAEVTGRILIHLGRVIAGPWYLNGQFLYIWDQSKFFEISMFDGDVGQFIDFYAPK